MKSVVMPRVSTSEGDVILATEGGYDSSRCLREETIHQASRQLSSTVFLGFLVIVLSIAGIAAWASFAPIQGAIVANGEIQLQNKRTTVQHREGGIVASVHVREGQRVEKGEVLLEIVDKGVESELGVINTRLDAVRVKKARYLAEMKMQNTLAFPINLINRQGDPDLSAVMASERQSFAANRAMLMTQLRLIDSQIADADSEAQGLNREVGQIRSAAGLLGSEISNAKRLVSQGFLAKNALQQLRRTAAEYRADIENREMLITRAHKKGKSLAIQKEEARARYVNAASEGLAVLESEEKSLMQQLVPLKDAMVRQRVTASIAGTVLDMEPLHSGSVLARGDRLMDIVPERDQLMVVARIAVADIDEVHSQQVADIRFTAFPSRSTLLVKGTVNHVSADRLVDQRDQQPYFNAEVSVDMASLSEAGLPPLHPGMPATVFINTKERTLLDYLLHPVIQFHERAMRET